jgi:hypothetical protein
VVNLFGSTTWRGVTNGDPRPVAGFLAGALLRGPGPSKSRRPGPTRASKGTAAVGERSSLMSCKSPQWPCRLLFAFGADSSSHARPRPAASSGFPLASPPEMRCLEEIAETCYV